MDKITASELRAEGQIFGISVSISGDSAIIGDRRTSYIFKRNANAWVPVTTLTASDVHKNIASGYPVSMNGDYAVVGGVLPKPRVYQNKGDTWVQIGKLTAGEGDEEAEFGQFVAISNNYVIVSAMGDDENGTDSGAAYVFGLANLQDPPDPPKDHITTPWVPLLLNKDTN